MINQLNQTFCQLPGVGKKTAQRFSYHLLQRDRQAGLALAEALKQAMTQVKNCQHCRTLTEHDICAICRQPKRHQNQLCVVETPTDMLAIEQSQSYQGLYFVLSGYLSPIDGIGAKELGLDALKERLNLGVINELILATNTTLEGEVTAHYLKEMTRGLEIKITRLAHGIPLGGELEYTDSQTLAHALNGRADYQ